MSDFKVVFTQDVPLSCRIDEMGKKVFIRGKKVNGTMLGCVPPGDELVFCAWVEEMLLGQVNVRPAPALQCTLGTGCMVSHGFTLEACLKELDETGRDLEEGELLWYGREERNSGMDDADCEWRGLATAVLEEYSDDTTPPPVWELVSFLEMWQQWYPEVKHYDTLAKSVANLSAYRWTTLPAQTVQVGVSAWRPHEHTYAYVRPKCAVHAIKDGQRIHYIYSRWQKGRFRFAKRSALHAFPHWRDRVATFSRLLLFSREAKRGMRLHRSKI